MNFQTTKKKPDILTFGHPELIQPAGAIKQVDAEIRELAAIMFSTMHKERGIGLAAPQIGESRRVFVVGFAEDNQEYQLVLINPVIEEVYGDPEPYFEGCLSIPGINANVYRPPSILISAVDLHENQIRFKADGLLARVIQHEQDHLDGKLFVDRLDSEEYKIVANELKKLSKKTHKRFKLD